MKVLISSFLVACTFVPVAASAQQVKLAKVVLGMTEAEVKLALEAGGQVFSEQESPSPRLRYLVAAKSDESYGFTFVDGKVAGYAVVHLLPEGKQPTVKTVRDSITRQTWTPASVAGTETLWISNADGTPASNLARCAPAPAGGWTALDANAASKLSAYPSTAGLMHPALVAYPSGCGVSIHMTEQSSGGDTDPVSSVSLQVLDLKLISIVAQPTAKR